MSMQKYIWHRKFPLRPTKRSLLEFHVEQDIFFIYPYITIPPFLKKKKSFNPNAAIAKFICKLQKNGTL